MGETVIRGIREQHLCRDAEGHELAQRNALAKATRLGARGRVVREVDDELVAYVSAGRWVGDCGCGAGVALCPSMPVGRCFACGAVHRRIRWPEELERGVRALLARPRQINRNWLPGEGADQLEAENHAHGIESRDSRVGGG